MISWLKLDPHVPEYGRHDEADLDLLVDWYYEFDGYSEVQREQFIQWLHALKLGVVTPIPNHHGYNIVKVIHNATPG